MLRTIHLHGALGKRFGRSFTFDVASPAEALRALIVQLKGFREHFKEGHYRVIRGALKRDEALDIEQCKANLGGAAELHIVPIVAGAASGLGKVLAGVALIALAIFLPPLALGPLSLNVLAGSIGVSLVLGGVGQMLTRAPSVKGGQAAADKKESFLFGGQTNVAAQGGPVPLVYGLYETGSVVVSAGLEAGQLA